MKIAEYHLPTLVAENARKRRRLHTPAINNDSQNIARLVGEVAPYAVAVAAVHQFARPVWMRSIMRKYRQDSLGTGWCSDQRISIIVSGIYQPSHAALCRTLEKILPEVDLYMKGVFIVWSVCTSAFLCCSLWRYH